MNRLVFLALFCLLLNTVTSQPADSPENELEIEGRGIRDIPKQIWDFFFGEGEDYDYGDYYDFNPNEVSSYTWYDPSSARRDSIIPEDEEDYSWGEFAIGAALALAPIGLLIAALPTGLFTIAVKKRSFGDDNLLDRIDSTELPLLRSLQEGDLFSLVRPQCQRKLFCELSQLGKNESASFLQKAIYYVSHLMPDNMSRRLRMQRLFDITRANQCQRFSCHSTSFLPENSPSNYLRAPSEDPEMEE